MVGASCGYPISARNERAHIIFLVTVNAAISSAIVEESAVTVCFLLRVKKLPERRPLWGVHPVCNFLSMCCESQKVNLYYVNLLE
jgi:hypothetical protein